MRTIWAAGWVVACGLGASALGQAPTRTSSFCDKIKALTADPTVAAAHWGVSVTTLDGTVLCGVNQAQLFRPASNNKLITEAAATALLGTDRRFTTTVVAEGHLADGKLHGNLRLVGGGDANFGAHDLPYLAPEDRPKNPPAESPLIADIEDLATQVAATGLRNIDGDVVGDDSFYAWEPYPRGWTIDDLNTDYGGPVSALMIHDSEIEIDVAPNPDGSGKAIVTTIPETPYYTVDNRVGTSSLATGCGEWVRMQRELGSRTLTVYGDIAPNAKRCKLHTAIHDPAEYAALALKLALERRGVRISGSAVAHHAVTRPLGPPIPDDPGLDYLMHRILAQPARQGANEGVQTSCEAQRVSNGEPEPEETVVATHQSPSVGDDLTYTAKVSDNLHAELLLRNLGTAFSCQRTQSASLAVVRAYLKAVGITAGEVVLFDGSGLSGHDLVTPRSLTGLLVYAAKQRWFAGFKAALPVGGVDGTLASRFLPPKSTLKGQVFAKTGTLGESRDLSGYVTAASGNTVVFSVMVDNHPPSGSADRVAMDRIVEAIAAGN